ncbi:MAG: hypothetical protein LBQ15_05930 [Clostridium sp.]|jgi:hypothetical protein|nr:hypothetical protein [Clostridium sp.]
MKIMPIVKKSTREFFSCKIWLVVFVFSWQAAVQMQLGKGTLSYWEFVLAMMTDHYYIFYFMVPFLVIFLYRQLDMESDSILIRSQKFSRYFFHTAVSVLNITVLYVALHLFIAAIIGSRLKNFADAFWLKTQRHEELYFFSGYFETPGLALIASVAYMMLGLTFMNIFIIFMDHFWGKRTAVIAQAVAYVLLIVGLHGDMDDKFPWLFPNHYLILHHGLSRSIVSFFSYVIVEITVLVLIFILFDKYWWKTFAYKKMVLFEGIKQWYIKTLFRKREFIIILGITGISVLSKIVSRGGLTIPDLLLSQFWGHGIGYFFIMEFLDMLVFNGLPVYLLCIFYQNCKANSNLAVIIRLKNKKIWLDEVMQTAFLFCMAYVLLTVCMTVLLGHAFRLEPQGYDNMKDIFMMGDHLEPGIWIALLKFIAAKVVELIFLFLVVILLDSWIRSTALSFFILLSAHGLCILPLEYLAYNPIGISFFARQYTRIDGNQIAYSIVFAILLLSVTTGYLLLRNWRIEKLLEDKG